MPGFGRDVFDVPTLPPPSVGLKLRPKRLLRGAKGVVKKAGKVAVKVHTAPIKAVAKAGKKAMMAAAKLAAKPIRNAFRKLATRRARLISWKSRKSLQPNAGEKKQAAVWTLAKMRGKGPIGKLAVKILTFTKGATLGASHGAIVGMTGAEIAAAAAAIVAAMAQIMRSLNKPGEAPEDPRQGEPEGEDSADDEDAA